MSLAAPEPPPAHVEGCPCCRDRWREATILNRILEARAAQVFPSRCPDETDWAVAAEGGLGRELTAHLDRCARCRDLWSYMRRTRSHEAPLAPGKWRLRQWAAVASLLLGLLLWARPWSPVPSASETIMRGPTVRLEASSERRPGGDVLLRWTSDPAVDRYRLRIWTQDGALLLQEELSATVRRLEASTLATWSSTLLWQVEALEAGREAGGTPVRRLAPADPGRGASR